MTTYESLVVMIMFATLVVLVIKASNRSWPKVSGYFL